MKVVVLRTCTLTLVDLVENTRLVVGVRRDSLGLSWHGGVAFDECGHDATGGLNTHGERCDIEEVLNLL